MGKSFIYVIDVRLKQFHGLNMRLKKLLNLKSMIDGKDDRISELI